MTGGAASPDPRGDGFPRQYARTRRFTLGEPRAFTVAEDGSRVLFLRTAGGDDPVGALWVLDLDGSRASERCVADPRVLLADDTEAADAELPPEERARRERSRETAGGIVAYGSDRAARVAVFTLGARAYVADVDAGVRRLGVVAPVVAPCPDPTGTHVAFVRDRALHVVGSDGEGERRLAGGDDEQAAWGLPEFIAAEEMGRTRGFWWAPDGNRLAVARSDERAVQRWYIGDPADPGRPAREHAYPAAGTANADVSLHVVDLGAHRVEVVWDRDALPYLVDVVWSTDGPLTLVVQSRDQRTLQILAADPDGGTTRVLRSTSDQPWVELVPGVPRWLPGGRLVHSVDDDAARRLAVDGSPVTPPGLQVRRLIAADDAGVTFSASDADPSAVAVWRCGADGEGLQRLTGADVVADAVVRGDVAVLVTRNLQRPGARAVVRHPHGEHQLRSRAETPLLAVHVTLLRLGERDLPASLLLPSGTAPDHPPTRPLPVLLDPYGGPHAQRVVRSHTAHLASQWFAEQGFAVLVADGRGTPGRGPAWERAVAGDLATAPLADQVDALHACAEAHPGLLDLGRVAIRGWSFGGYLAALAVLRRPDVFHAAVAGAPVTDWSLYDTHYTERYLGLPQEHPEAYRRSSVLDDAASLRRPLLLIHGLADDNVVAAHTLRLSSALLAAGRPHTVLPLSGITHMTPQETVAENLLLLQLSFLRDVLGVVG